MKIHQPGKNWQQCRCGKRGWVTRSAARSMRKATDPSSAMSAYLCPESGLYHLGHLPPAVREGRLGRQDVSGPHRRLGA